MLLMSAVHIKQAAFWLRHALVPMPWSSSQSEQSASVAVPVSKEARHVLQPLSTFSNKGQSEASFWQLWNIAACVSHSHSHKRPFGLPSVGVTRLLQLTAALTLNVRDMSLASKRLQPRRPHSLRSDAAQSEE